MGSQHSVEVRSRDRNPLGPQIWNRKTSNSSDFGFLFLARLLGSGSSCSGGPHMRLHNYGRSFYIFIDILKEEVMFFWQEDLCDWILGITFVKRFCSWMTKGPRRKKLCAWIVRSKLLNLFGPAGGKIGKWYQGNDVYRYPVGQKIQVRARNIFGYGVNARGVISAHTADRWGDNAYEVIMDHEINVDWFKWMRTGKLPDKAVTVTEKQIHFKWNIEHQFVPDDSEVFRADNPIGLGAVS